MCEKHIIVNKKTITEFLPKRDQYHNKYNFGHTIVIGGSKRFVGAPILAAKGALYSGCGIVSICVPDIIHAQVVNKSPVETIVVPLPSTKNGCISFSSIDLIIEYIITRKVNTVCIGCGLDIEDDTRLFVNNLLKILYNPQSELRERDIFTIVDADAINLLTIEDDKILSMKNQEKKIVMTPHLGEFCRLRKVYKEEIENILCEEVLNFSKLNNIVLLLKGPDTIISDGDNIFINSQPDSTLAKAGSGDVLSGIISGLIYQVEKYTVCKSKLPNALKTALLSVYIHSQAAKVGSEEKTEFSFSASDIISYIPSVLKNLK